MADAEVDENAGATLDFEVTLNRALNETVTVGYGTADVSASAGADYTSTSGTLTFAAQETSKTVSVSVLNDGHNEGSETMTLSLSSPSPTRVKLADADATGTINNHDPMPLAWMMRFGRTVGSQVVDALTQRLDGAGASHVTVAGINVTGGAGTEPEIEDDDPFGLPEWAKNAEREADGEALTADDKELSAAFALAVPRPETEAITAHLAFFQRVMAMIRKRLTDDTGGGAGHARQRDIDTAVRQVIGGAIDADDVIDLFAVAGLSDARLDILGDEFLGRVAALEQKNLALETLRKLLNDQIRITERTNIVQSRKFREALEDAMLRYTNRAITTAEMISHLIDLAKSLRDAQRHGDELGLSGAETAFYDALAENRSAREAMQSDTLRLMARKLTEMVKNMPKLDWTQRESVRASLRRNVRRLLAKYGYPPDLAEDATQLVLRQAELSTENSG